VALHLHVAEGTVKSRIRKGLRQLRLNDTVQGYRDGPTARQRQPGRAPGGDTEVGLRASTRAHDAVLVREDRDLDSVAKS
jgi:hypothetical protein